MAKSRITKDNLCKAFGSLPKAAKAIGTSRVTLNAWIKKGEIPEVCINQHHYGKPWHDHIRSLGFDPVTLKPLK